MITRHYTFSTQKYSVSISIDVILFVTGNCFIVSDALVQRIVRYIFGMLNLNGDEFVIVGDGLILTIILKRGIHFLPGTVHT